METMNKTGGGQRMPVLFIGHGSPINIVLSNGFTRHLSDLGKRIPRPSAIMVISAHWLTRGTYVTCDDRPRMIYDFYGFPEELYQVRYECQGSPDYAKQVTHLGNGKGNVLCNHDWGLDHASYSILTHLFPDADIPVFEMSLDYTFNDLNQRPIQYHYELGMSLRSLRDMGVLVIGSGNIVHNLRTIDFSDIDAKPFGWALEADETIRSYLVTGEHQALIHYPYSGGAATQAVPTLDHYLPMIYAISLQQQGDSLRFTYEGFQHGSISMRCFMIE